MLVIALGWIAFSLSYNYYKKNKVRYLKKHNLAIAIFNYHLLCSFLFTYANTNIPGFKSAAITKLISDIFFIQISVFLAILLYFIIEFILILQREKLNNRIRILLITFYSSLVFTIIFFTFFYKISYSNKVLNLLLFTILYSTHLIAISFSIKTILKTSPKLNKTQNTLMKRFGILIIVIVSISLLTQTLSIFNVIGSNLFGFLTILPVFLINIFSLLRIKLFISRMFPDQISQYINPERIEMIYSKYNISKREIEILELVCNGKSNKEIEDQLFISLPTIKEHISNIYKKTKVKNRVQLTNLFSGKSIE